MGSNLVLVEKMTLSPCYVAEDYISRFTSFTV